MTKLALLAVGLVLAACQADNKDLARRMEALEKNQLKTNELLARIGAGGGGAGVAPNQQQRPQRKEPDRAKTYAVPVDNDAFDGPADAKITVVKAYDYACPFCERVRPTMAALRQKYGNDLRVVSKQMVVHPKDAMAGALAFCAANEQGKAKPMDDLIWDKGFKVRQLDASDVPPAEAGGKPQKCWDTPGGCKLVVGYAQELGLDLARFKADMKGKCMQIVETDKTDLQRFGVSGTPAFFINGRYISGAVPIENFSTVIDEELQKANQRVQQGTPAGDYYKRWVLEKGEKSIGG